jgi:hypothetical protein
MLAEKMLSHKIEKCESQVIGELSSQDDLGVHYPQ